MFCSLVFRANADEAKNLAALLPFSGSEGALLSGYIVPEDSRSSITMVAAGRNVADFLT